MGCVAERSNSDVNRLRLAGDGRHGRRRQVWPHQGRRAVKGCRTVGKKDMVNTMPETFRVTADGVHLTCDQAQTLSLAQKYFLF